VLVKKKKKKNNAPFWLMKKRVVTVWDIFSDNFFFKAFLVIILNFVIKSNESMRFDVKLNLIH
jgi:hypothetical protein